MKTLNKEIPFIYIYVYARFRERISIGEKVFPNILLTILRQICRVPKVLHYPILKQMEECSLIKRINKKTYQVLKSDCIKMIKPMGYDNFWR